ncbi:MAG TPA: response regulator [Candidatus Saccharimonadales bacterium]|nr:response regulator [Candidatus Saccharimonadales bacterium]
MAKILLVEDDNNLREIYGARLSAEGYEIVSAPDGEEALAIAVKEKPDLIISDIMMPKISGFDMLDILRNAPETKDTKIIMMTALSQAEDKERADKLGADLYLVKSQVTLEDVAESVRKILGDDKSQPQSGQADAPAPDTPAPPAAEVPAPPAAQPQEAASPPPAEPSPVPAPAQTPATPPPAPSPAPAPVQPDDTQVPDAPQPTDSAAPTQQQPQNDTATTSPPPVNPTPAAAPAVQIPPAEPPANPVSAPPAEPAKPEPKKIEVTLPDEEKDKPAEPSPAPVAVPDAVEEALSIGPNVAEALAQEEDSSADSGKREEKKPEESADAAAASQPSTVIKPSEAAATESTPPEEPTVKQGSPNEENNPNKKVIQPLNDPTKGPDLNALLAQEEQKEQGTSVAPIQQPPDNSAPGSQSPQDEHPDDFSKISL